VCISANEAPMVMFELFELVIVAALDPNVRSLSPGWPDPPGWLMERVVSSPANGGSCNRGSR
jgi:hypothetical protein